MASEHQINANRLNAQSSTGPRTPDGKATSAHNSTTHNLTAKGLIILPGQHEAFAELHAGLRTSLIPHGPLQEIIFTRALESAWTLQRCRFANTALYENAAKTDPQKDPMIDGFNEERYTRIQRYAREAENSMYKAMRELAKLQEEASYRQQTATNESPLSEVCSSQRVTKSIHRNKPVTVQPPQSGNCPAQPQDAPSSRPFLLPQAQIPPPADTTCAPSDPQ